MHIETYQYRSYMIYVAEREVTQNILSFKITTL